MRKIKNSITLVLLFTGVFGSSQTSQLKMADKKYEHFAYVDASEIFERIVAKGYKSPDVYKKIGNSYYFQGKLQEASKWYGDLFKEATSVELDYYFRYSDCLKANGEYKKANEILERVAKMNPTDSRVKEFDAHKNYLDDIQNNSNRYAIENAGINSEFSDFGGTFLKNKFVFTSNRETGSNAERIHSWTNQPFSDIYYCDIKDNGNFEEPTLFSTHINTLVNESSPTFTADGNTMYFTRNNFNKGKFKATTDDKVLLKIYKAVFDGKNWGKVEELPFNSDQYSCAHPALSLDEKTLYFTSDMPGTIGQSDLFSCAILADGSYGKPQNLGPIINTEGRESFPFISNDNELYFASDGHLGIGGLDIFVSKQEASAFSKPLNVGTPVNSNADDFGFSIDTKSKIGFFTSNRTEKNTGFDDIYKLQELKPLKLEVTIEGEIVDEETGKPIQDTNTTDSPAATIKLYDNDHNVLAETKADRKGNYSFKNVKANGNYYVRAEKEGYATTEIPIRVERFDKQVDNLKMERQLKKVRVGDDLRSALGIKVIHYDLNSWEIRKDATVELAKVKEVLTDYPEMKIDIRAYTDSRYTESYNLYLSEKRALEARNWLIKNGIAPERISAKGFGESVLVNDCKDGVPCSESEHEKNRRSEFIIIGL